MRISGTFIVFLVAVGAAYGQSENEKEILAEIGTSVTFPINYTLAQDETFMSLSWRHGADDIVSLAGNVEVYHGRFEGRALVQKDNYGLTLSDLQFDDSGSIQCALMTTKGSEDYDFILQVLASPSVNAEAVSVVDDSYDVEKVLATCVAVGASLPVSLSWYYQDELIVDGANSIEMPNSANDKLVDATLLYQAVPSAKTDRGKVITCVVSDALGRKIERQVTLDVSEPTTTVATTTMQASPQITKFPRNPIITMVVGSSRTFPCQAVGVPEPTVTWYKDDIALDSKVGDLKLEVLADEYTKSGVYMCDASNKEGLVSKQFDLVVQGPPVISKSDETDTENITLEVNQIVFQLECRSDGKPHPAITWEIEGVNTTGLKISESSFRTENGISSVVNISATHFRGSDNSDLKRKVTCTATNDHGVAKKEFVVSVRRAAVASNTGLIAGIVVALLVALIVVLLIVYLLVCRKRQASMTTSASPESAGMPALFPSCCGDKTVKSKELKEEEDVVTYEHDVKEANEDGTKEEKQKLTEAEEKPAKEQESKEDNSEGDAKEDEKMEAAEAKPKKSKAKRGLPMQCCRGKQKVNEKESEEEVVDENEKNETGNGDTKQAECAQDEKQGQQEKDRDSGKGDTLEKVIEEPEEPNAKK